MTAPFTIVYDRVYRILFNTGSGFWRPETAIAFLDAERAAIEVLDILIGELSILFDALDFAVQGPDVIEILSDPGLPIYRAKRAAFVAPPGLGKLQVKRGAGLRGIPIFEERRDAHRYLIAGR